MPNFAEIEVAWAVSAIRNFIIRHKIFRKLQPCEKASNGMIYTAQLQFRQIEMGRECATESNLCR